MNNIFESIFNIFLILWENIEDVLNPLLNFLSYSLENLIPILLKILTWIFEVAQTIINVIGKIFKLDVPQFF